jgi:DNA-binding NarL/FixJ family response regulator
MLRILVVDTFTPFRESLQSLLQDKFTDAVIKSVETCMGAEKEMSLFSPEIVFINIHLSTGKGFELARMIKRRYPAITILALADSDLPEYHVASRRCGIDFFVPKDQWPVEKMLALVDSILMNGEAIFQGD